MDTMDTMDTNQIVSFVPFVPPCTVGEAAPLVRVAYPRSERI